MKLSELYDDVLDKEVDSSVTGLEVDTKDGDYEELLDCYEEWFESEDTQREGPDAAYEKALDLTEELDYNEPDLQAFSLVLNDNLPEFSDFERTHSGIYVTALAENLEQEEVNLPSIGKIDSLGYRNTTDLIVKGDTGAYLGAKMQGGNITVTGDVQQGAGMEMEDGNIEVIGSAGSSLGNEMKGGKIRVRGKAGKRAGYEMENGEIRVGSAGEFLGHNMTGGVINVDRSAGGEVGFGMRGGEIHIQKKAESVGSDLVDGKIVVEGEVNLVGNGPSGQGGMAGGEVYIGGDFELAENIEGGKIFSKEKGDWREVEV
jgi:formylmethanofuran dehydrogenase subunit C